MIITYNTILHVDLLQSDRLAAGLTELGVKKGDCVGIWAPNCMEWVVVQYAAARAGLILVRSCAVLSSSHNTK